MITAHDYRQIRTLESTAERLGFGISFSRYGENRLGLVPTGEALPIFSRDAEIYSGTVEELLIFLHGWEKSRMYTKMLGFSDKKLERAEQNHRNEHLVSTIRNAEQTKQPA